MYRSAVVTARHLGVRTSASKPRATTLRSSTTSSNQKDKAPKDDKEVAEQATSKTSPIKSNKTTVQLDEELRRKLSGISGDGGEAGIEYENGQPVAMKRSVKNNMFRYI